MLNNYLLNFILKVLYKNLCIKQNDKFSFQFFSCFVLFVPYINDKQKKVEGLCKRNIIYFMY